ncbi:MAG: carbohydrate kinase [Clostridiales bacterium]|nr:carbohydrate kinase [Clostridiales bacterium]
MSKLVCMGELLIDFQSKGSGTLKNTDEFVKKAGGAPANVCVQAKKLGCEGMYLSQVGNDAFGEFLIDTLKSEGIDTRFICKNSDYDTSLAFVSFGDGGERQFSFYRRTAADLYFTPDQFYGVTLEKGDVLEFGSVALSTKEARRAHDYIIQKAHDSGAVVCFDPNLRFNLWGDRDELKRVVHEYAKKADVIKVGDDELAFLTEIDDTDKAVKVFFGYGVRMVAVTRGAHGAKLYLSDGRSFDCKGFGVKAVDTTGAGDSFFGGLIAEIMRLGISKENIVGSYDYGVIVEFACKCGSYTTTNFGAIAAMGDRNKILKVGE